MIVNCFKPVIDKNCKVLILGSMPSAISRKVNFYYGNPTNRFWKIMSDILGENLTEMTNAEKADALLSRHIALYDVFSSCEINGSMDGNIKNAEFNDIPALIKNTDVKTVYITSKKAYRDFIKKFARQLENAGVNVVSLPSTSGANRAIYKTDDELSAAWQRIFKPI